MAEVSRRLGARVFRISFLPSAKVNYDEAFAAVVSIPDSTGHEPLTELTEQDRSAQRGEQPCLGDSGKTLVHRRQLTEVCYSILQQGEAEVSSAVTLPVRLTGHYLLFLHEGCQSFEVCPKQQRLKFVHNHRPARCGSVCPVAVWANGQLLGPSLNGRVRVPPHPLRTYRTLALPTLTGCQSGLCDSRLWPVKHQHQASSRAYSWKKDDKSSLPLYRSRTAYYDILQVSPNATQSQIKTAYYKQSLIFHPDRNAGSEEATRRFAEISEAYMVLGSKWLRRKYDNGILSQADLQGTGRSPAKEPATARTHGPQQRARSHSTTSAGGKVHFDFDEFYRAHYGEQLQREQEMRRRKEMLLKMRQEQYKKSGVMRARDLALTLLLTAAGLILISLADL